jgi:type VII secretion effector (TIGR04197 family)|uniref:Type VII secretion effector, SACOL2603 family n=1 Tax=Eubacterium cellulosolvens (strain ATCC 43171 / JCM 9499 / 6) TaxID=633697 RepID=I5AXQ1_EUBC6
MAESGNQGSAGMKLDYASMDEDVQSIGGAVASLVRKQLTQEDQSTVTVRTNSRETHEASQNLLELFVARITQDAENIMSVKDAYNQLDVEIQNQIKSIVE